MPLTTKRLEGKVAVVTGSSSGIGRAISLAYAQEGAHLVCADLTPIARAQVKGETTIDTDELIRKQGGQAIFVKTDVTQASEVESLIQQAVHRFQRIDIIVNNAGVSLESRRAPAKIHETAEETWDTTMAINSKSVFLCCKYAIAQMLKQEPHASSGDRGWIINMSSIFGLVGGRHILAACYAPSKGAVSLLTKQIAIDYAEQRIHCNAICPGYTDTAIFVDTTTFLDDTNAIREKHPFGGIGRATDIAGAAVFLASQDAGWMTGVCMPVDGGYTAI